MCSLARCLRRWEAEFKFPMSSANGLGLNIILAVYSRTSTAAVDDRLVGSIKVIRKSHGRPVMLLAVDNDFA